MKSVDKLKSLKNPFKKKDFIEHKELRGSALKKLAKLYDYNLDVSHGNRKLKNVFSENKDLVKLLDKEELSVTEIEKVNKLIINDFGKYQKDLNAAKKVGDLSKKKIDKKREKGNKVFFELGGMFKSDNQGDCIGKKSKEFCKTHSVKLALCGILMTAGGLTTAINLSDDTNASMKAQASSNIIEERTSDNNKVKTNLELKKSDTMTEDSNKLDIYSQVLNNAELSEFTNLDLESDSFKKSKQLYLGFMSELSDKTNSNGNVSLNKNTFNSFLKAEFLYFSGLKKNLENKSEKLKGDKLEKNEGKINTATKKLKLIEEQLDNLEIGKKIGFSYQKHGITIDIKSDGDTFEVQGLNKFNY